MRSALLFILLVFTTSSQVAGDDYGERTENSIKKAGTEVKSIAVDSWQQARDGGAKLWRSVTRDDNWERGKQTGKAVLETTGETGKAVGHDITEGSKSIWTSLQRWWHSAPDK
jgi:hypothetical protein